MARVPDDLHTHQLCLVGTTPLDQRSFNQVPKAQSLDMHQAGAPNNMERITSEKASTDHGITTFHNRMPNGELRFRLKKADGTAYIRTEADSTGGWQESHYHKFVQETYIVQKGWIAFAQYENKEFTIKRFVEGQSFTTKPHIIHNVYMPKRAVIHTVKHGNGRGDDRNTEGTEFFDKICKSISNENEVLEHSHKHAKHAYSEEYQHFDNLIWQGPVWVTAIFAISIQGLGESNLKTLQNITGLPDQKLVAVFLILVASLIACLSHARHRFRIHQKNLKDYKTTPIWKSGSAWTQLTINAQWVVLFVLAALAIGAPIAISIIIGILVLVVVTIRKESQLR